MEGKSRRPIPRQWIVRVVGSCLALGLIFWLLPTGEIWAAIRKVPLGLWMGVLAVFLMGHLVVAIKWWLLALRGSGVPFSLALRAHFAGLAANLCLPGIAGGDMVRAGLLMKASNDKPRLAVGSLADRLIDSLVLFLLACGGAMFLTGSGGGIAGPLLKTGLFLAAGSFLVVIGLAFADKLPLEGLAGKVVSAAAHFGRRPGALLLCFGLSVLVQAVFIVLNAVLARSVGLDVGLAVWFFAWPLAKLLALVPISISGLGVREAGLAALMAPFDASPAVVVAVGLLWQSVLFASGLIGALALMLSERKARPNPGRDGALELAKR